MDAERWQRLSPLLDALFELDPAERRYSLDLMREEDPQTASELEELLKLEGDREDFLAEPLVAPLPGLRQGAEIGPYRIERMLGEGGMGQVWLAARNDGLYHRRVALKLLRPGLADPNLRLRFTRERQILARLAHPHIARLLDAGVSGDHQPYLALEFIEGEPITDYCRKRRLSIEMRLKLFAQVCAAVSHAHANLIVHRDLKPSNIMVTPSGEVRLLDFGIAKLLDTESTLAEHTRTGVRAFTLHYAAPEQVRGEPVTTMTDVYALGVVLYELLTDARPYRLKRQTDAEWEEAILLHDPLKPSLALERGDEGGQDPEAAIRRRRARVLAGDLDNIVLKALAKKPEQRYASVEALAQDLLRYQAGKPVQARSQGVGYRMRKYIGRHRWALASGVAVAGVLSGALAIVAWQAREAVAESSRAQAMQGFVFGLLEGAGGVDGTRPVDLRALLDASVARANRELTQEPRARAEVFGMVARLRLGLGDTREAVALLDQQAMILAQLDGAPESLQLEAATLRGQAYRQLGQAHTCIATMAPWLETARREQAQLPVQAADFKSQLARCRRSNGERNTARLLFERSLALRRDMQDDAGIAENLLDLAALHADAGDGEQALRGFREALAHLRQRVGPDHPLAIQIQRSLGLQLRERGDADGAEAAFREALALATQLHGPQHPTTLTLRRQLAAVHVDQGRFDVAASELAATHDALVARVGERDAEVAATLNAQAIVAWERGDLAGAQRDIARAVSIWRETAPADTLAGGLFNQAMVLHAAARHADALQALYEARRLRAQRFGQRSGAVGDTDRMIGEVLAAQGRMPQARERLRMAVEMTTADQGASHPRTRQAVLSLARLEARQGVPDAVSRMEAIAGLKPGDSESTLLHWRARAYLAEARCADGAVARGREGFDAIVQEMQRQRPDGGALQREVVRLRGACELLARN